MPLDIARIRGLFATLADGYVHLDGPAGSLVPESVAAAIGGSLHAPIGNLGGAFPSSVRAGQLRDDARSAMADLVGGEPHGVVLGPNMTSLTYTLSRALAKTWQPGDEVVLSRLDHDANIRPWVQAAEASGATVRWAEIDIESCELPEGQYDDLLTERTRLVAVTAASNAVGTRPSIRGISDRAHALGALVYVDAVHAAPHIPLDLAELGADFVAVSAYKWCGPHISAVIAVPEALEALHPDKLLPSPERSPDRFETGTPPFELYAGVSAAVDHIAALNTEGMNTEGTDTEGTDTESPDNADPATAHPKDGPDRAGRRRPADRPVAAGPDRRKRVLLSMAAVEAYERELFAVLEQGLRGMPHVTVWGAPALRTPTVSLTVAGRTPRQVTEELGRARICAWDGDYYARELMDTLGLGESGGAVRLGLAHYTSAAEVDYLLDVLGELA
ncbi:MAG: aminotransferase class V-fold PLP-dependent enzyme [Geodermatophilaceae bacterium]